MSDAELLDIDLDAIRERDAECDEWIYPSTAQRDRHALLAEVDRLRATLTTARRDALVEAADALEAMQTRSNDALNTARRRTATWLRARAAQEEGQ